MQDSRKEGRDGERKKSLDRILGVTASVNLLSPIREQKVPGHLVTKSLRSRVWLLVGTLLEPPRVRSEKYYFIIYYRSLSV